MTTSPEFRYAARLRDLPQPGQGRHSALLGVANLGVRAGKDAEQIHQDIQQTVSNSTSMADREIRAAILKAVADHRAEATYRFPPKPARLIHNGQSALQRIIGQGTISEDVDLWEASPVRLRESTEQDPACLLSALFAQDDLIFIGDRLEAGVLGQNIRPAADWVALFRNGGTAGPFITINPLSGAPAPKKDGEGVTYRGDGNVKTFRHCLAEFDTLSRESQIRFWSAAKLPIRALIDSGGKSIHAWLDVQELACVTATEHWGQQIKIEFYERLFAPIGVDRACSNPSRLSRLPGYFRTETGKYQRLLWLSPEGREVVP